MTPTHRRFVQYTEEREGHLYWTGPTDNLGRGVYYAVGDKFLASRVSWMIANERTAEGRHIFSTCGVDACIHPDHLADKRVAIGSSSYDG